jgi:hypothetical protein
MEEDPYRPPAGLIAAKRKAELSAPPRRFRARLIPASCCFALGGLMTVGILAGWASLIPMIARYGVARVLWHQATLRLMLVTPTGPMYLVAGWLWLRRRWLLATLLTVASFGWGGFLGSSILRPTPASTTRSPGLDPRATAGVSGRNDLLSRNENP